MSLQFLIPTFYCLILNPRTKPFLHYHQKSDPLWIQSSPQEPFGYHFAKSPLILQCFSIQAIFGPLDEGESYQSNTAVSQTTTSVFFSYFCSNLGRNNTFSTVYGMSHSNDILNGSVSSRTQLTLRVVPSVKCIWLWMIIGLLSFLITYPKL